jgi:hypothetical protein
MSFTRFHDDPARIQKQVEQSTYTGMYRLTTPGQGMDLPFMQEPQVRLQGWGANFDNNIVNMESDLFGLTRPLNRDLPEVNDYKKYESLPGQPNYRSEDPFIQESRATNPAWMYKDLEQPRWEQPFLNPLNGIEIEFPYNIQSRIVEKDNFVSNQEPKYFQP